MAIQIKLRECDCPKVYTLDKLAQSGKSAFREKDGNLYFIGLDCLFCVETGEYYVCSSSEFEVDYFCDVSIILDKEKL